MKKIIALLLTLMVLVGATIFTANAQVEISDELFNAMNAQWTKPTTKDNISLYLQTPIGEDKYLVRYSRKDVAHSCDEVEQVIGEYMLYVPQRPLPQIFANGKLYEVKDAYEQGVIDDADLHNMSGFEYNGFDIQKSMSDELAYAIINQYSKPVSRPDIYLSLNELIDDNKYLVRYSVVYEGFSCDVVIQRLGEYKFTVPSRPLPEIFVDGELYKVKDAYELGIIDDADLEKMSQMGDGIYRLEKTELIFGDSTADWHLDIFDATYIQMYLASLVEAQYVDVELADFDRDNKVSVLDATGVQMKLADLI